ncbi:unnamed protein product [Boreogadus saida]
MLKKGEDSCQKFISLVLKDPEVQDTFPMLKDLDWASLDSPLPPVPERTSMPGQGPRLNYLPRSARAPMKYSREMEDARARRGANRSSPAEPPRGGESPEHREGSCHRARGGRARGGRARRGRARGGRARRGPILEVEETFSRLEELDWTLFDSKPEPERTSMPGQGPRPERRDRPGLGGHRAPGSSTKENRFTIPQRMSYWSVVTEQQQNRTFTMQQNLDDFQRSDFETKSIVCLAPRTEKPLAERARSTGREVVTVVLEAAPVETAPAEAAAASWRQYRQDV